MPLEAALQLKQIAGCQLRKSLTSAPKSARALAKIKELTELDSDENERFHSKDDRSCVQHQRHSARCAHCFRKGRSSEDFAEAAATANSRFSNRRYSNEQFIWQNREAGNLLQQLKRAVEHQQRNILQLDESKVDKASAQALFEQFRIALGELNSRLGALKKALIGRLEHLHRKHDGRVLPRRSVYREHSLLVLREARKEHHWRNRRSLCCKWNRRPSQSTSVTHLR